MDSSAPFPPFSSLQVVDDMNGRHFLSYLYPKGSLNDHSSNCLLPAFGIVPAEIHPTSIDVAWPVTGGLGVKVLNSSLKFEGSHRGNKVGISLERSHHGRRHKNHVLLHF
ncbi:hypothetical protein AVEN_29795-1 [Araneus ventricosus]|uniref:Uncharacterized protein n=1 Tax=Araneus ventricosus TaxID=182803 RepID=A0A4Y2GHU2_ARAVE|nr:hypothetical protein AVEN_29795-1 [Araneus ventricosus]